jgi:hypothetical protein
MAEVTIFTVGLAGLTAFYGLERFAKASRQSSLHQGKTDAVKAGAFWIHIGSFALYNALIGYLLVHPDVRGLDATLLYFVAMAMHFVTNDFGLRDHHKDRYDRVGRWLLAGGVLAGWLVGVLANLPDPAIALLFAFLAGGVVLNVLKEELPQDRQSRFLPFLVGAVGYSGLLVVTNLV